VDKHGEESVIQIRNQMRLITLWRTAGKLPRRLAYGVSVSSPGGMMITGGEEDGIAVDSVHGLKRHAGEKPLSRDELPSLPRPVSNFAGGMIGSTLYFAVNKSGVSAP